MAFNSVLSTVKKEAVKLQLQKEKAEVSTQLSSTVLLSALIDSEINQFLDDVRKKLADNRGLVNQLKPILDLFENSLEGQSIHEGTQEYYRVRNISFKEGERMQTNLSITKLEYSSETMEIEEKEIICSYEMNFQKLDYFSVSLTTGLFFANTSINTIGLDENSAVVKDVVKENTVIPAAFLNFNFGLGTRYLAPTVQFGIHSSQELPIFLTGTGITIPAVHLAVTGGGIWAWNQRLDGIELGQTVDSSIELQKHIKHDLHIKPNGWYLGVQYNF